MEGRYNSTYGFVVSNNLEKESKECFGNDWEAEDDVNQIQDLICFINKGKYLVSHIEHLDEDDILVTKVEEITHEEIKDKHEKIRSVLMKYGNEEYGDWIIDDICEIVGIPATTVYYEEGK